MNIAVILAGGSGSRFGGDEPKQFAVVGGKTVLEYSIEAFEGVCDIDEICVVSHPDWIERVRGILGDRMSNAGSPSGENHKVYNVVAGGNERYMSSINAIMAYIDKPDDTNLIFHDAARPFVSRTIIEMVLDEMKVYEAVGVGIPATDTLWEVAVTNEGMEHTPDRPWGLLRVPDRKRYWQAQTPQAFRLPVIRDAYQRAIQDPQLRVTDDCGVVCRYMPEVKVHIVEGSHSNIKITYKEDMDNLRSLMGKK